MSKWLEGRVVGQKRWTERLCSLQVAAPLGRFEAGQFTKLALEAISQEEDAAASIGINVTKSKLFVTLISAVMMSLGGVLYAQYQTYINPETVSGIGVSLQMVFGVIAGGMFVMLGPTVGAVFTLLLAEGLRLALGDAFKQFPALDLAIYGLMLVLFIIYMPKGILGAALEAWGRRGTRPASAPR